ncbi:MAG TPA: NAD(P)-dependent alcohol dehydrogenase [Acidobacteriota bacterium]|nr:NAD(P)-dependent alcohol dehydrogenase [Acidobacteriota bacterium]
MDTMKSWRLNEFGSIENLQLEEIPVPEPAEGEVLVRVEYAALNPADAFVVMGRYPEAGEPPFSVGRDGCGIIETPVADGRFEKGERVVLLRSDIGITRDGMLAEYAAIPETCLAPIPDWWTPQEGAAGPLVNLTCWQALKLAADLRQAETVVITGASGGIGTAALMLSKAMGAFVIALSRDEGKRAKLLELGADVVLDTDDPDLVAKVRQASPTNGADVVIENICGPFLAKSIEMAGNHGRICIIGALGGIKSEINPLKILFKRLQVHGIQVGDYTDPGVQSAWSQIVETLRKTWAKPLIDKVYPFTRVQEAFRHLRRGTMGKIVVGPMS